MLDNEFNGGDVDTSTGEKNPGNVAGGLKACVSPTQSFTFRTYKYLGRPKTPTFPRRQRTRQPSASRIWVSEVTLASAPRIQYIREFWIWPLAVGGFLLVVSSDGFSLPHKAN